MNSQSETSTTNEQNEIKIIQLENPLSLKLGDYTIEQLIDSLRKKRI